MLVFGIAHILLDWLIIPFKYEGLTLLFKLLRRVIRVVAQTLRIDAGGAII